MALTVVRGRLDQNAVSGNDHIVLQDEQVTNLDVLALYLLRVIHVTLCFVPLVHTLCLETALATGLTEGIHALFSHIDAHYAPIKLIVDFFVGDGAFMVRKPLLEHSNYKNGQDEKHD